jgi:hypothetical protein
MPVLLTLCELFSGRTWKVLYIYGRSGIRKTFIVEQACKNLGFSKFYLPVPGNFFFATYRPELYDYLLFEEFEFDTYKSNFWQIKRVLERKPFGTDVKFRDARSIRVVKPVIFVSNYTLRRKRIQIISAQQLQLVHFIPL